MSRFKATFLPLVARLVEATFLVNASSSNRLTECPISESSGIYKIQISSGFDAVFFFRGFFGLGGLFPVFLSQGFQFFEATLPGLGRGKQFGQGFAGFKGERFLQMKRSFCIFGRRFFLENHCEFVRFPGEQVKSFFLGLLGQFGHFLNPRIHHFPIRPAQSTDQDKTKTDKILAFIGKISMRMILKGLEGVIMVPG